MRRLWKSLALSLGVMVTGARGQDTAAPSQPAASIGRPVASIGRPVALPQQPVAPTFLDPRLQPVSFNNGDSVGTIVRGKAPDAVLDRPTSIGRPLENVNPSMFAWRAPGDEIAPRPQPTPPLASSGPVTSTPIASGPVSSGPIVSDGRPVGDDCVCGSNACGSSRCGLLGCGLLGNGRLWSLFNHGHGCDSVASACDGGMCLDDCGPCERFYVKGEYLLWWTKSSPTPALVTQGSAAQPINSQSALIPGTTVLFGNHGFANDTRSGARFTAGYWLTDDHLLGIEGDFFFLGENNGLFRASSTGGPGDRLLGRPAFAPDGTPIRELVAGQQLLPDGSISTLAGTVSVSTHSNFYGGDLNLRTNLMSGCNYTVDLLAGYRHLALDEGVSISENLQIVGGTPGLAAGSIGSTFMVHDSFSVQNRFDGGQIGASGTIHRGPWSLGLDAKLGLGVTQSIIDINGFTTTMPGTTTNGGLLTRTGVNGNIGRHTRDVFSVVPEVGLNIGYQWTEHIRLSAGYSFLYWSDVTRPGNQIDTVVDRNQAFGQNNTGANRPTFSFHGSDYWAQGLNFGLEFRW